MKSFLSCIKDMSIYLLIPQVYDCDFSAKSCLSGWIFEWPVTAGNCSLNASRNRRICSERSERKIRPRLRHC
jgi:hypothetical protein